MKVARRYVVLAVVSSAAGASHARAQIGPIQVVSESSATDSTDFKQVVATCPPGTIAFSGGASLESGGLDPLPTIVHQSLPQGNPPASWLALAQERTPTAQPWGITSVALCATVTGYELVDESTPFDSTSLKSVTASCPPGKVAIGGGGGIFFFNEDLVLSALTPDDSGTAWRAGASEVSAVATSWLLNVKVSCAPALDVVWFGAHATQSSSESHGSVRLMCPPSRLLLGGGHSSGAMYRSRPMLTQQGEPFGWRLGVRRTSGSLWSFNGAVLCYRPLVFADGFESGATAAWSSTEP